MRTQGNCLPAVLLGCSASYLLMPCLFFLGGWVTSAIAIPLGIALCVAVFYACKGSLKYYQEEYRTLSFTRWDVLQLLLTLLVLLIFTELIGFHGHVSQSGDFTVRNAIYNTLVRESWPLYNAKGEYFIYYHAFWLPSAGLCKLFRVPELADTFLFIWSYLGLALAALLLFCRLKGRILLFTCILLLSGNISELFKAFQMLAAQWRDASPVLANYLETMERLAVGGYMRYLHFWAQVHYTFNHAVPVAVLVALVLSRLASLPCRILLCCLLLFCSPFGGAAAFVLIGLQAIVRTKTKILCALFKPEVLPGLAAALIFFCYLLGQAGAGGATIVFIWSDFEYWKQLSGAFELWYVRLFRYFFISLFFIAQTWVVLDRRMRRNSVFYALVVLVFVLPLLWVGRVHNEFLFKGSIVVFMLYSWLLTLQWKHSGYARKGLILCIVFLSCLHVPKEVVQVRHFYTYSWEESAKQKHIRSEWNGHLNHPGHYAYNNFWGKNICSCIFRDNSAKRLTPPDSAVEQ